MGAIRRAEIRSIPSSYFSPSALFRLVQPRAPRDNSHEVFCLTIHISSLQDIAIVQQKRQQENRSGISEYSRGPASISKTHKDSDTNTCF